MLAVGQWREAADAGRPFTQELATVKALAAGQNIAIADDQDLISHAATGVPTLPQLRETFDRTADEVVRAGEVPDGLSGWLERTISRVFSIVTIRRADGMVDGNTPSAILARAGMRLRTGDLPEAVSEMAGLEGRAAAAAAKWLDAARARLAIDTAIADATAKALAAIGEEGKASTSTLPTSAK